MTPITADMIEETPMIEQINPEQDGQPDASVNGHHPSVSPTMAEAIAERELKAILEAMLFVSPEPLPLTRLIAVLGDVTKCCGCSARSWNGKDAGFGWLRLPAAIAS